MEVSELKSFNLQPQTLFISSDHHFGDTRVRKWTNRDYKNLADMDTALMQKWNNTVADDSHIIYLGDFTLGGSRMAKFYFSNLKGNVYILNNHWHHDQPWLNRLRKSKEPWQTSTGEVYLVNSQEVITVGGYVIHLNHYPVLEWDTYFKKSWHLHGHTHGAKSPIEKEAVDVGIDNWNEKPVSFETIRQHILSDMIST
jgi:calcineurin-like phosphoesterase family protein